MRTYDSRHYVIVGFQEVQLGDRSVKRWLLSRRSSPPGSVEILEDSCKYVDNGAVYYCLADGSVEMHHQKAFLPDSDV